MGIKDKVLGKKSNIKGDENPEEKEENPEDHVLTQKAKEAVKVAEDTDIDDFLREKRSEIEEEVKPEEKVVDKQVPIEEPIVEGRISNVAEVVTMYIDQNNFEEAKGMLDKTVQQGFTAAIQAGIQITKGNANEVKSILKYLTEHGYLVVISAEKVENLFDGQKK